MEVERITKVSFTQEEKKALKTIANINCKGIKCEDCPFNLFMYRQDVKGCIVTLITNIVATNIKEG